LCCSTWLSDFKSVSTAAARYQQLAINQAKLSGACGRLKCCLNYELDGYMDALEDFPESAERLKTQTGNGFLIKTDVFRRRMTYVMDSGPEKGKFYTLRVDEVKIVLEANKKGEFPPDFKELQENVAHAQPVQEDDGEPEYEDVIGAVELRDDKKRRKKKKKRPLTPLFPPNTPPVSSNRPPQQHTPPQGFVKKDRK
jgi:cell fate regulator YaaT (PSP1 superfamily)